MGATDCDDSNASVCAHVEDADCDGARTSDDCDDGGGTIYSGAPAELLGIELANDGNSGSLASADFAFIAENSGDEAGSSLSPAGDVDGDGLDDLFVGALFNDDGGSSAGKADLILSHL